LIRAVIDPENYKGGVESFENQTKCRLGEIKLFGRQKKNFYQERMKKYYFSPHL